MSTSIGAETTTCRSCNVEMPASALLCPNCGRPNVSTSFFDAAPSTEAQGTQPPGQIAPNLGTERVTTPPATPWPGESATEVPPSVEIPSTRLPWETQPEAAPGVGPHGPAQGEQTPASQTGQAAPTPAPPQPAPRGVADLHPTQGSPDARPSVTPQPQQPQPRWLQWLQWLQWLRWAPPRWPIFRRVSRQPRGFYQQGIGGPGISLELPPQGSQGVNPYAEYPQGGQAAPGYYSDDAEYEAYLQNPFEMRPLKPALGFLLELLGYVGLLGFGHMYGKHTERGVTLLLGWWLLIFYAVGTSLAAEHLSGYAWLVAFGPLLSGWWAMRDIQRLESRRREAQNKRR